MELTSTAKPTSLRLLTEAAADFAAAQTALESNVLNAIRCGASWAEVGAILGVSKQTAHARYGQTMKPLARQLSKLTKRNTEASDRAALRNITSKISDTDVAGDSKTPSIFSDAPAPATELTEDEQLAGARAYATKILTEEREAKAAKKATAPVQRQHGRIIEEPYEGMARPGTGKGPQVCKGCGSNNHHGTERGQVYWNDGCKPTKYDTAEETEFLKLVYKEAAK